MTEESKYDFPELLTTFPAPFVAHVEINRPKKYNAFSPAYVRYQRQHLFVLIESQRFSQLSWTI